MECDFSSSRVVGDTERGGVGGMHQECWATDLERILWEDPALGGVVVVIFASSGMSFVVVAVLSLSFFLRLVALEFQFCRPNSRRRGHGTSQDQLRIPTITRLIGPIGQSKTPQPRLTARTRSLTPQFVTSTTPASLLKQCKWPIDFQTSHIDFASVGHDSGLREGEGIRTRMMKSTIQLGRLTRTRRRGSW